LNTYPALLGVLKISIDVANVLGAKLRLLKGFSYKHVRLPNKALATF
jgi:hypothetical protein